MHLRAASSLPCINRFLRFALLFLVLMHGHAQAENGLPEGTLGWDYYTGIFGPDEYAPDPVTACQKTAKKHMGTPLKAIEPYENRRDWYKCIYPHFLVVGGVSWHGSTLLRCKPGYSAYSQGVCRKEQPEVAVPLTCQGSSGNPVQFTSGAKVQHETDLVAGTEAALHIKRTYRSVRENGLGQSAGAGWSFSFERAFYARREFGGPNRPTVSGALSDGSYFQFSRQRDGTYRSDYDRSMALVAQGDDAGWLLTTPDGTVERFTKVNDTFRLTSAHTRDGMVTQYAYNANNQLSDISSASGRRVTIKWQGNTIASITGASGGVRYEYEQADIPGSGPIEGMERLVGVHFLDRAGAEISSRTYHYEDPNQRFLLTGITDEHGKRFATYAYNVDGRAVLSEHAGGAGRYTFEYPSRTSRIVTDPLGSRRTMDLAFGTDGTGRIVAQSQPAGAGCAASASARTYSAKGDVTSTTDFNGNKTCLFSDPLRGTEIARITGLAKSAACPASIDSALPAGARKTSTRWHPDVALAVATAAPARLETKVYNGQRDAAGKVVECAGGALLPNGKPIAVVCRATVQASNDSNGALGFAAAGTGPIQEWRYTYNRSGQLLTSSGPLDANGKAESASMSYYADSSASHRPGDLASVRNGVGEVTTYLAYSEEGLPTKIAHPNGRIVESEYDPRQRLISSTVRAASTQAETTRYEYDVAGQLIRMTAPDGAVLEYSYDEAHRLTGLRDRAGNSINFTLDAMGNTVRQEVKDPNDKLVAQTTRAFDALNRLQREQKSANDLGARFEYDAVGNLTASTDPLARVSKGTFDTFNRLIQQTLPAPDATGKPAMIDYAYTPQDQLASVLDPRRLQTRYVFNGLGQQTALISPDTGTTSTQFDGAGNAISSLDAAGRKTAYRYDAAGRVTGIGASTFEYGAAGTPAAGCVTAMTDEAGKTVYAYDGLGRLLRKEQTSGAASRRFVTAYTYGSTGSAVGHVTSMTYPSGNRIDITYDSNGKPSALGLTRPNTARITILSELTYQPFGAVRSWLWGNHSAASPNKYERQFDLENRLVSYPLGHLAAGGSVRTLSYDAAGRIVSMTHKGNATPGRLDQRYYYDGRDRLIGFDSATASQRFEYDANGNRTKLTVGPNSYLNTIDAGSNRLTSTSGPVPAKRNTYDATGSLISDGTLRFGYGSNGRLNNVSGGSGGVVQYRYNGLGQRTIKSDAAGASTYFVYDEAGRMVGEYDTAGIPIQETIYLGGMPVAVIKPRSSSTGENAYYVYADHLPAPRVITRASDNRMVWRWDGSNPFGQDSADENPSRLANFIYNLRFPGQYYDSETSLHNNYYRDYDSQTGRYIQSDLIGLVGGINTYMYAAENPLSFIDPLGLSIEDVGYIYNQMKNAFNDIKPQGDVKLGEIPKNESGATEAWSGDIVVPLSFAAKKCLSEDEWSSLFFTLFHEGMHSTDGFLKRLITKNDISDSHHNKIHNRVSYEKIRPVGEPRPMWGKPRPSPVSQAQLYQDYFKNSPDCKCVK
ncbi:RHS repeat-associated core domain-containing protein [Massilia sp. CCM 8734]|uniref:RHS repeat-associated core domain-containing protein n=1 Tax=Massilia sp. CCM 8734 TaxID=2609283 RepID=UPI001422C9F8|nr:RHS repeat-associated core domain-containing protein [Massilia sp. CCM 8734]